MIRGREHPASGQLALFALCGDLVIAIEAMAIHEIRRTAETVTRRLANGVTALELDAGVVAGWDLGELLGFGTQSAAWVVIDVAGAGRLALRIGRCFMVDPLPVCRAIPRALFADTGRAGALAAGFSLAGFPDLAGHVAGVVVDPSCVLTSVERGLSAALVRDGHEALDA